MANTAIDSNDKLYVRNENIAVPTTFQDSSTANPKTITASGDAKQLPVKFNSSAGFFNGSSDYVVLPDHADWDVGTGDFTIEGNFFFTGVGNSQCLISRNENTDYALRITAGGNLVFDIGGSAVVSAAHPFSVNTWYHVAAVRSGTNCYIWVNGTQFSTTGTNSTNISGTSILTLGCLSSSLSHFFGGWMKEVRISNSARYTGAFTPSTTQFSSDSNTKLLLHFDTPASSPIAPAIYFDGTGDYLSSADHADWDFGTGDVTAECFFMKPAGTLSGVETLIDVGQGTSGVGVTLYFDYNGGSPVLGWRFSGSSDFRSCSVVANRWYHAAVVRSGTTLYLFLNGVLLGSTGTSSANITGSTAGLSIGRSNVPDRLFTGYLREIRVSNSARYTSAFTPSQTGFTVDSNTKLYVKGDDANGATTFVDSETTPKTITTNGDTKIKWIEDYRTCIFKDSGNTGHKPYPAGLAKVDFFAMGNGCYSGTIAGSGYATAPDSADWDFGTGDFTLETHARWSLVSGTQALLEIGNGQGTGITLQLSTATTLFCYVNGSGSATFAFVPVVNMWYHLAASRASGTLKLFINGVQVYSGADSNNVTGSTQGLKIGNRTANPDYFNGRMDNMRIASAARYTATFNPPYDPNTSLTNYAGVSAISTFFMMF